MHNNEKTINILFVGTLVPDTQEFLGAGNSRAGNLAQAGLVEGLRKAGAQIDIITSESVPAFPRSKVLFIKRRQLNFPNGMTAHTTPCVNILLLREVWRGIYVFFCIVAWAIRNRGNKRFLLTYNIYTPPIPFVMAAARISRSKIVPILFDMGMPPADFGCLRNNIYKCVERVAKWLIPWCDGCLVINRKISEKYAAGVKSILIDGGITEGVIKRLPDLSLSVKFSDKFRMLCAGSLWKGNGVDLLLDAIQLIPDKDIELIFAGHGGETIKSSMEDDHRIHHLGMLDHDKLFEVYGEVDLLLNIRLTQDLKTDYLFPSKVLEYLVVGKPVLSTAVAHLEEVYGDYCYILKEETAEALADKILDIKNTAVSERVALGQRARHFMLQEHTWRAQCLRLYAYLQSLC